MMKIASLLLIFVLLLTACGPVGGGETARRTITIAWIHKTQGNPVFDMGQRGAMDRAAELSVNGPVEVRVIPFGPVAADAVAQMQLIENVAVSGVDAIAVSCNDPTACIEPINSAVEAGIPVMTWDSDSPESKRFTFLSIDNYEAGRAAAQLLVDSMGTTGKVALLTGVPGAWNLEERMRGFRETVADYPDIEIVAVVPTNEDINLGVQRVEETMQKHPDLNGWFFVGLWPLFAERGSMPLWEEATLQRGLKTVSFDTLPLQLDLLHDGYLAGLVGQKYWGWGADSVQILYDRLINGKIYPSFIDSGMDIVTARNVDAMRNAWQTNDFSQPLPPP